MNQVSKVHSVDLPSWDFASFWFMINLGACVATCLSSSCFNTHIMAVIKHRQQVWLDPLIFLQEAFQYVIF